MTMFGKFWGNRIVVFIIYKFSSVWQNRKLEFSGPGPGAVRPEYLSDSRHRFKIRPSLTRRRPRTGETGTYHGAAGTLSPMCGTMVAPLSLPQLLKRSVAEAPPFPLLFPQH
jgi:hypothetical protein